MMLSDKIFREAAERFPTPLYVFDTDALLKRFQYFRKHLGEEIGLTYCMKTNPFLTAASLPETQRIEVCSDGEFRVCRSLEIPPEKLLISGVLKRESDLAEILDYCGDRALYTAESPSQLELLNRMGADRNLVLGVLPRLTNGSQFGMDEETVLSFIQRREEYKGVEFRGIHFFSGTQKHRLAKHRKELQKLDAFFQRLEKEADFHVPMLEYGTGFGVPYFEGQAEDVTSPEQLSEFRGIIGAMRWKGAVTLEMGRALAYDTGYYITKVCDVKANSGKNYAITDGGIHQLHYDGQIRGMYVPEVKVLPGAPGETENPEAMECTNPVHYSICGSLCTTNDILIGDYTCWPLREGDLIVFTRTGAYSVYEGMSLFLTHELPGVVLCSEEKGLVEVRKQMRTHPLNTPAPTC